MIITRVSGGLGNQLFQYAAGKALAAHHNVPLVVDTRVFEKHRYRQLDLDNFCIAEKLAGSEGIASIIKQNNITETFTQPHYHFYPDFFRLPPNLYLTGYWQSERYFLNIRSQVRQALKPAKPLTGLNGEMARAMEQENSVSIHVRRGDYAQKKNFADFFGVLDISYYEQAIERICRRVRHPVFYIFSDDPAWCRDNFDMPGNFVFADHNTGPQAFLDMVLMSRCRHNIIANSTFSWWGAWLNENPQKVVVAPERWFKKKNRDGNNGIYRSNHYDTRDLIPAPWIRL